MNNELLLAQVYRRAAGSFLLLTIVLLALVAYVVLPKALVVITPTTATFEENIFFTVGPEKENDIDGLPIVVTIAFEQTFKATGEEEVTENFIGEITIVNNYSQNQPLIKTTRLLTENGILLRLDKGVTIPAGGSVIAPVYLDEDSAFIGSLPAGRLTIPGLWEGIQDKIYGEILVALEGDTIKKTVVKSDDVTFGQNTLRAKAETEGRNELISILNNQQEIEKSRIGSWELHAIKLLDEEWFFEDGLVGRAADNFVVNGNITFKGVFYNKDDAKKVIEAFLVKQLKNSNSVIDKSTFVITDTNLEDGVEVMAMIQGSEAGFKNEALIESGLISGLTVEQAITKLQNNPLIEDAKIELSPFWVKKIPKRKIDVVILKN